MKKIILSAIALVCIASTSDASCSLTMDAYRRSLTKVGLANILVVNAPTSVAKDSACSTFNTYIDEAEGHLAALQISSCIEIEVYLDDLDFLLDERQECH